MKEKFTLKYLLFILWIVLALGTSFVAFNGKSPKEKKVIPRVYTGQYKGHIADKYPEANEKGDKVRKEILANIKTKKVHTEKNHRITECFDSKNRLIYKIDANLAQRTVTMSGNKFHKKAIELNVPEEEGYIYDNNDKVIIRLHRPNLWTYSVDKESEVGKYTYLEQGGIGVLVTDIKYFENNKRIETEEYINRVMSQLYTRTEKEFVDDKLVSEKEFVDQELDDSFIMYSTEKKYNEKAELIYKTVERKDKTEMDRGKEIKKVYKNKVKAIVKRQKVGEPVKIVDVIEYLKKDGINHEKYGTTDMLCTRYIFDDKGNLEYKTKGVMGWYSSYLYHESLNLPSDMNKGYLQEAFYVFIKNDGFYKYFLKKRIDENLDILKFDLNGKRFKNLILEGNDKDKFNEFLKISLGEVTDKKYKIKNVESKEIKTLEELLNGYKYE